MQNRFHIYSRDRLLARDEEAREVECVGRDEGKHEGGSYEELLSQKLLVGRRTGFFQQEKDGR